MEEKSHLCFRWKYPSPLPTQFITSREAKEARCALPSAGGIKFLVSVEATKMRGMLPAQEEERGHNEEARLITRSSATATEARTT